MQARNQKVALPYGRVSSKSQESEGSGLESQLHRCLAYAQMKGYEIGKAFQDVYTGGGDYKNRSGMMEMFKYIDDHPHINFVVVIDDISRLAREVSTHIILRKELEKRDVRLECLNFTFQDTPEGELIEIIMAAQSQYHRVSNKRQVVQKQKAMLELGGMPFGGLKIGYERALDPITGRRSFKPNQHAMAIKEALEGFAYKRFESPLDVAKFLKDRGVFGEREIYRCSATVRKMLKDPFYMGRVGYKQWEVSLRPGWHEAIISEEVFNLNVKRLTKGDEPSKRFRYDHNPDFELCGFVKCEECGTSLRGYWCKGRTQKYAYYECKNRTCSMNGKTFRRDSLHSEFEWLISGYTAKEGLIEIAQSMFTDIWNEELKGIDKGTKDFMKEITEAEERLDVIKEKLFNATAGSFLERELTKTLEEKLVELEGMKASLIENVDLGIPNRTATEKVFSALKSPLKMWVSSDIQQKQRLFHFFFDEQLVYEKQKGYRTAHLSPILRLFERLDNPSANDVEMARIELASIPE